MSGDDKALPKAGAASRNVAENSEQGETSREWLEGEAVALRELCNGLQDEAACLRDALRYCRAEAQQHKKTPAAWAPAVIDRVDAMLGEGSYASRAEPIRPFTSEMLAAAARDGADDPMPRQRTADTKASATVQKVVSDMRRCPQVYGGYRRCIEPEGHDGACVSGSDEMWSATVERARLRSAEARPFAIGDHVTVPGVVDRVDSLGSVQVA